MKQLFDQVSYKSSKSITQSYSTSFSIGIRMLGSKIRPHIYAIYGMVRLADEIVDTFHDYQQKELLDEFQKETFDSIRRGISLNPVLNSFQHTVNQFGIENELIEAFFRSMRMDLTPQDYNQQEYNRYIYGSAQVVGLMCLRVFVHGKDELYECLKPGAERLGAAFQKVNFLRDLQYDQSTLGRTYFPYLENGVLTEDSKELIEADIEADFRAALQAIEHLPPESRFGVYTAYRYYYKLFSKIKRSPFSQLFEERMRIPNAEKIKLLLTSKARITLGSSFL